MRILQVHTRYREPGGEDVVVAAEAALLRGAGHDVVTHEAVNPSGAARAALALASSSWNVRAERRIRSRAEDVRPDIAHVHNTWYALSPSVLRGLRQRGVPVVATLHNYRLLCVNAELFRDGGPCDDCVGRSPVAGIRHRCYRNSVLASAASASSLVVNRRLHTWDRDVELLLVLSEFARERFIAGGLPAERLRVTANFVDDPGPRPAAPSESRTVLFVGRLVPQKGVAELLAAWDRANLDDLELVIAGDGPGRARFEQRAGARVRFVGQLAHRDVQRLLLGTRALVLPSLWYEGQPMAVLEAFAAGAPVLGSSFGGIGELVSRIGTEWVVDPTDVDGFAQRLTALGDDDHVDAAGARARARYLDEFTPSSGLRRLEDAYRTVLEGQVA